MDKELAENNNELSYLREEDQSKMGTENIDRSDIKIPRMKIVQPTTTDKMDAEDGEIIHSITGQNYGKKVVFISVVHWKIRLLFQKGTKIVLCRSEDGTVNTTGQGCKECESSKWTEVEGKSEKPACPLIYTYLIATKEELTRAIDEKSLISPLILSFKGLSTDAAKTMNTAIKLNVGRHYPIYSQCFEMIIPETPREFPLGKAFIPEIKIGNFATQEEYEYLKSLYEEFSKVKIGMSMTEDEDGDNI